MILEENRLNILHLKPLVYMTQDYDEKPVKIESLIEK
jgi:hypothetical protein